MNDSPTSSPYLEGADHARRFLFEEADIRGETVLIDSALKGILANHQYAPGVQRLLGEFVAASVLISNTLKFDGRLTLQVRAGGQVPLLMAESSNDLKVRAIARGAEEATALSFHELIGEGQLAITVDPRAGRRYQGIVPLAGQSLADSLDSYFANSEQLHTRLWLDSDGNTAGGLLLQQLPAGVSSDGEQREADWQHACTLAQTLKGEELRTLPGTTLVHRLYHQDRIRLFDPRPVQFSCSCSRERSLNALQTLGEAEIDDILREQGSVTMDCEFCNQRYVFSREELFPGTDAPLH
jgi:molecular chaperone Hsp33